MGVVWIVFRIERDRLTIDLTLQQRDPHFQMPLAYKYDVEAAYQYE